MASIVYDPRRPAPHTGMFEEVNIYGVITGAAAYVEQGEPLPGAPRGFTWRSLGELSATELRSRAIEYRAIASTVTAATAQALLTLADRFDALANKREGSPVTDPVRK